MLQLLEKDLAQTYKGIMAVKQDVKDAIDMYTSSAIRTADDRGGTVEKYQYFLYPFKGFTLANHGIYNTLALYLAKMIPEETEAIVSIEADGIGIATLVAAHLRLPLVVAKSYHYGVDCVTFTQQTGYYNRTMYMSKAIAGKKVAIVDCMVSTGGTVIKMIDAIKQIEGTELTGFYCVNDKSNYREKHEVFDSIDYGYLFHTAVENGEVNCKMSKRFKQVFWADVNEKFYTITERLAQEVSNKSRHGYGVGAIIVDSETFEIVSWGYRRGHVHAEQDALSMLKDNTPDWADREYMLYCTMEPCTYRNGEYTPCSHLVSDLPQIKWVIVGQRDVADEQICDKGIQYLLTHGKNIRLMETGNIFRAKDISKENGEEITAAQELIGPSLSFA